MVKLNKKNKEESEDFKKSKQRVGKKKLQVASTTFTDVKAKAIVVPVQSVSKDKSQQGSASSLTEIRDIIAQVRHHNVNFRRNSVQNLFEVCQQNVHLLAGLLGTLIQDTMDLAIDPDQAIRQKHKELIILLLKNIPASKIVPFHKFLTLTAVTALTHVNKDVREHGIALCMSMPCVLESAEGCEKLVPLVIKFLMSNSSQSKAASSSTPSSSPNHLLFNYHRILLEYESQLERKNLNQEQGKAQESSFTLDLPQNPLAFTKINPEVSYLSSLSSPSAPLPLSSPSPLSEIYPNSLRCILNMYMLETESLAFLKDNISLISPLQALSYTKLLLVFSTSVRINTLLERNVPFPLLKATIWEQEQESFLVLNDILHHVFFSVKNSSSRGSHFGNAHSSISPLSSTSNSLADGGEYFYYNLRLVALFFILNFTELYREKLTRVAPIEVTSLKESVQGREQHPFSRMIRLTSLLSFSVAFLQPILASSKKSGKDSSEQEAQKEEKGDYGIIMSEIKGMNVSYQMTNALKESMLSYCMEKLQSEMSHLQEIYTTHLPLVVDAKKVKAAQDDLSSVREEMQALLQRTVA